MIDFSMQKLLFASLNIQYTLHFQDSLPQKKTRHISSQENTTSFNYVYIFTVHTTPLPTGEGLGVGLCVFYLPIHASGFRRFCILRNWN